MLNIQNNISLKAWNTFGIQAQARQVITLSHEADLASLGDTLAKSTDTPPHILGGGSNLVLSGDIERTIIKIDLRGVQLLEQTASHYIVQAGAGEPWHEFVLHCLAHDWFGLENLSLIPGTVGASPIQNIGAYGVELRSCFAGLRAWNYRTGKHALWSATQCQFAYRDSAFKHGTGKDWLVLAVQFKLNRAPQTSFEYGDLKREFAQTIALGNAPTPLQVSQAVCSIRQSKLPDPKVLGNAGSFFKNPIVPFEQAAALQSIYPQMPQFAVQEKTDQTQHPSVKLSAAWLIDQCGWKGKREGEAGVHEHHALVLVNYGGATGRQILTLAQNIQDSVATKFAVKLEAEPIVW
jgi:UDP-N-acetylmuramate dehydrogenase